MQVTQTNADGLKREFKVVVPAGQIEEKVQDRLTEVGRTVRLPGFRPGKVPMPLLRKKYLPSIMGEVLEAMVNEGTRTAITDNNLRPAIQPKVEITSFEEGSDLEFAVAMELLPEFETMDFSKIELEREKVEIAEEEINKALETIAERQSKTEPADREAKSGDVAVIDFVGRLNGEEFPGGKAEGYSLKLGSGTFIPGFEDQLIGAKAGEERIVTVTFPEEYGNEELAGKPAEFTVKVTEVREVVPTPIDDELAKAVGLESLDALKNALREEMGRDYTAVARNKVKRKLLDALAEGHDFAVPQSMVDMEFDAIWQQLQKDKEEGRLDEADKAKSEDELKAEYRGIAERRVRLGLVLSEVGRKNNIQVNQDDLNRALMAEARRFPGQEQLVFQYYQKNPDAMNSLRAPVYEDKVIDFILELAKVSDKAVTAEELMKDPDAEGEEKPAEEASK
ncbi:trigger factor [Telmatospirillum sp. J64-1]|uniref:trigger factor n=1 Tax=Telmatospirillum sp. J64-1 TaxID=2502183 RepID=UPI00115F5B92|nr:trigger factor [Telmatospirillum sp. J64-1]